MDRPNRYQPVTHDRIVERLTRVLDRWKEMHREADRLAVTEAAARHDRVHAHEHSFGEVD